MVPTALKTVEGGGERVESEDTHFEGGSTRVVRLGWVSGGARREMVVVVAMAGV